MVRPFPVFPDEKFEIKVLQPEERTDGWLECDLFRVGESTALPPWFRLPVWRLQSDQGDRFHGRLSCGLQTRAGTNWRKEPAIHLNVNFPYMPAWCRMWTYTFPAIVIVLSLFGLCRQLHWVRFSERQSNEKPAQEDGIGAAPLI
jgi:hypothetical protein